MNKSFLFLCLIIVMSRSAIAEPVLSQQANTLPKAINSLQLELGLPFPLIWALKYNHGLTDKIDIGLNGSFLNINDRRFGVVGFQGKLNILNRGSTDLAVSLLADYFNWYVMAESASGFFARPALELTRTFYNDEFLLLAFLGSYMFVGDLAGSCYVYCGDNTSKLEHLDVYIDPGAGFEVNMSEHWDLFLKGYALINAESGELGGGGILGFVFLW